MLNACRKLFKGSAAVRPGRPTAFPNDLKAGSAKMLQRAVKRIKKKYANWWQLYVFLLIPLVYIIIFKYVPMIGVQIAFRKYTHKGGIWGSKWVGMSNFIKFFNSPKASVIILNTLKLSLYSIFVEFPFPIIFALLLNAIEAPRFKKTVQTITYMPHFISTVVLVGIIMQMFNSTLGIMPRLWKALTGMQRVDVLASPSGFVHLYTWSGVWQGFGWGSIMYLAALTAVSPDLHEAAQIDGATRWQRVLHVDLPCILPTITIMLILRMGSVMSIGFEKAYLMQNDLNISASEVISTYEYKIGLANAGSTDYSRSAAIGLFNSVINMIMLIIVNAISGKLSSTSLW